MSMSKIPFIDKINVAQSSQTIDPKSAEVTVRAEIKLWSEKWMHKEIDDPGKGDDVGFVLVFGNDGEITAPADLTTQTVEDTLEITEPVNLKLMSLCIGSEYELWIVSENGLPTEYQVERCHVFQSGIYTLQVRKKVTGGDSTPYFEIPCHYICCIAMLFQIEMAACPACPGDCTGRAVVNGCFENGLTGWEPTIPEGGSITTESIFVGPAVEVPKTYYPVEGGNSFALLKTDGPGSYTSLSQTISVCAGDKIEGYSFFYTLEVEQTQPPQYSDTADVKILDNKGNLVTTLFNAFYNYNDPPNYGITDWIKWEYTFAKNGTFTLLGEVTNAVDSNYDSYLGLDGIGIIK